MKVEKAIAELETFRQVNIRSLKPTLKTAITMGIAALKHYQEVRPTQVGSYYPLLPGETK